MAASQIIPEGVDQRFRKAVYDNPSISDEEIDAEDSEETRNRQRITEIANALGQSLQKKRDKAVQARMASGIENVWRTDRIAYEGIEGSYGTSMLNYATGEAPLRTTHTGPKRSEANINIIRPKCDTAYGRYSDILLPTDDKNWGLRVTPVPELLDALDETDKDAVHPKNIEGGTKQIYNNPQEQGVSFNQQEGGQPAKVSDVAKDQKRVAEKKMKGMERKINDQLVECGFNGECRKAIFKAVKIGTGIIKGPFPSGEPRKRWPTQSDGETTIRVLEYDTDPAPIAKSIDPWDVYPDPECGDEPENASYFWERGSLPSRKLRTLRGLPGYLDWQIDAVLKEPPSRLAVANPKEQEYKVQYNTALVGTNYEIWEYNGDLDKDDMIALGCDCDHIEGESASACVLMVNERAIKVQLNPMDTGALPYHFFRWSKIDGMPWGAGVAREGLWPQQIITNALRAMMENAGKSAGANIVIGSGIEPANGHWEVTGDKIWWPTGDEAVVDAKKGFGSFQIENFQAQFQAIIEMALKFVDIETQIPTVFSGEQPVVPQTLGATNIMIDSNNVTLRSRVKIWDDDMTNGIIGGFYDWNMQDPDCPETIKGDMYVDARGTSVLLERDQQGQHSRELLDLKADPDFADMVDWEEVGRKYLIARNLNVILPEDKIKDNQKRRQEQPPPADPLVEVAKLRAEGEMAKVNANIAAEEKKMAFEAEREDTKFEHERQMQAVEIDLKAMELSGKTGVELDKIKAHLSEVAQKLTVQVKLATDKNVKPAAQVATPIAEPGPRAAPGRAFQD